MKRLRINDDDLPAPDAPARPSFIPRRELLWDSHLSVVRFELGCPTHLRLMAWSNITSATCVATAYADASFPPPAQGAIAHAQNIVATYHNEMGVVSASVALDGMLRDLRTNMGGVTMLQGIYVCHVQMVYEHSLHLATIFRE